MEWTTTACRRQSQRAPPGVADSLTDKTVANRAAERAWARVRELMDESTLQNLVLIVSDDRGEHFVHDKGNLTRRVRIAIAR